MEYKAPAGQGVGLGTTNNAYDFLRAPGLINLIKPAYAGHRGLIFHKLRARAKPTHIFDKLERQLDRPERRFDRLERQSSVLE